MAQGTSLLGMIPAGAAGALTHHRLGNVVNRILPGLISGILVGTYLGGTLALRLPEGTLRVIFAVVVIWLGGRDIKGSVHKRKEAELAPGSLPE